MQFAVDVASWILIVLGSFFTVVGALGLVRLPDVFTRMHAASVIETLGVGLLIFGMILQAGFSLAAFKLFFLLVLYLFIVPVVTHALAQAALHTGVEPELAEDRRSVSRLPYPNAAQGRQP